MFIKLSVRIAALAVATGLVASIASAITIPTVPVGDNCNDADTTGYGTVAYAYDIGTYEVTAGQYTAFLNAVAAIDSNNLYNSAMESVVFGCGITRVGSSGNYTYAVDAAFMNRPVNNVSYWDACRFANWLHNGQTTGAQDSTTTEDGAYTLTLDAMSANTVGRKADAQWAVPNQNEWYKAAYYKGGGTNAGYWLYPTRSNTAPGTDLADPIGNNANWHSPTSAYPIDAPFYSTQAGEFQNSSGPYGTFDQGGNMWEWNEAAIGFTPGIQGGAYSEHDSYMRTNGGFRLSPTYEDGGVGFRVCLLPAPLTPCNRADADGDGTVTPDDLFTFLDRWFAQNGQMGICLSADVDASGLVSPDDLFVFLDLWFEFSGTTC